MRTSAPLSKALFSPSTFFGGKVLRYGAKQPPEYCDAHLALHWSSGRTASRHDSNSQCRLPALNGSAAPPPWPFSASKGERARICGNTRRQDFEAEATQKHRADLKQHPAGEVPLSKRLYRLRSCGDRCQYASSPSLQPSTGQHFRSKTAPIQSSLLNLHCTAPTLHQFKQKGHHRNQLHPGSPRHPETANLR